jgi:hypothetical protein
MPMADNKHKIVILFSRNVISYTASGLMAFVGACCGSVKESLAGNKEMICLSPAKLHRCSF